MKFIASVAFTFGVRSATAASGPIAIADADRGSIQATARYATGPNWQKQSSGYVIASLDATGTVTGTSSAVKFEDDAILPGCNAGFDSKNLQYIKTTSVKVTQVPADPSSAFCKQCTNGTKCCRDPTTPDDHGACFKVSDCSQLPVGSGDGGNIITIDAKTGAVTRNVSMTGEIAHPPFGAWDATSQLLYSMVPYSYTAFGLFSFSPTSGSIKKLATWQKEQLDGIGLCEGLVLDGKYLLFQFGGQEKGQDYLIVIDLKSFEVVNRVNGFYGPFTVDPLNPSKLLAIQNKHNKGVAIVSVDPLTNSTTEILQVSNTTLGRDLRAQDQASLTVDPTGTKLWFVASYNVKNGSLFRGIFSVDLAADRSSGKLTSEKYSFGAATDAWLGRLDYLQDEFTVTV